MAVNQAIHCSSINHLDQGRDRGLCEPPVFVVLMMLGHCSMFTYLLYLLVSGIHSTEMSQKVPNMIHIIGNN